MADKKEIKLNEEMEQYEQYVLNPILWAEDYFAMPIQKILPEYENLLLECRKT
ncbi:MAG: hypothetical protein LBG59_07420 [Candidatus Peribacteria bacterium]|jgi:hypothetical protein|nr:hypothetical protein [Candidatus Peribacteria bacterium]